MTTKKELFRLLSLGNMAITVSPVKSRQAAIDKLSADIDKHNADNAENPLHISMDEGERRADIYDKAGNKTRYFCMLPPKPYTTTKTTVRSADIIVGEMFIDKTRITPTETGFSTPNFNFIFDGDSNALSA